MTVPRKYRKLFQDSIVVEIPLDGVTADLGVVMKRTRAKRIESIYQNFPSLKKEVAPTVSADNEAKDEDEDHEQDENDKKPLHKKKKQKDETIPQREQYGSVLDYLEAKYVRGVMLGDEIAEDEGEDDRESVYSEDSWLDDSLLKRDVAEQVLSHSTQTKVGVENDDDDEFFVNVGNLEVEDNDLMNYDPLEDDEKAAKKVKKRKRSDAGSTKTGMSGKGSANGTLKKKKGESTMSVASEKNETSGEKAKPDGASKAVSGDLAVQKEKVEVLRGTVKDLFDRIVADIKAMSKDDLPRKKKSIKVTISVPEGKSVGDVITFRYVLDDSIDTTV